MTIRTTREGERKREREKGREKERERERERERKIERERECMCHKVGEEKKFLFYLEIVCFPPFFGVPDVVVIHNPDDEGRIFLGKNLTVLTAPKRLFRKLCVCEKLHIYLYLHITCVYVCMCTALYSWVWRSVMRYDAV